MSIMKFCEWKSQYEKREDLAKKALDKITQEKAKDELQRSNESKSSSTTTTDDRPNQTASG